MRGQILREFNKKPSLHKTSSNECENSVSTISIPKLDHAVPPSSCHLACLVGVPQHLQCPRQFETSLGEVVYNGGRLGEWECYLNADIVVRLPLGQQFCCFPIPNVGLAITIATADAIGWHLGIRRQGMWLVIYYSHSSALKLIPRPAEVAHFRTEVQATCIPSYHVPLEYLGRGTFMKLLLHIAMLYPFLKTTDYLIRFLL